MLMLPFRLNLFFVVKVAAVLVVERLAWLGYAWLPKKLFLSAKEMLLLLWVAACRDRTALAPHW